VSEGDGGRPVASFMKPRGALRDALRYWERRRLWYNLALAVLCGAWVWRTWPHFRPAFTLGSLLKLLVLAALANVCYSAAYLVDIPLQESPLRDSWRKRRWALWVLGTLLALAFACYWIADEIYPFVGSA
jgi:cytochrome bd-type quinol oxidase subunit 2